MPRLELETQRSIRSSPRDPEDPRAPWDKMYMGSVSAAFMTGMSDSDSRGRCGVHARHMHTAAWAAS